MERVSDVVETFFQRQGRGRASQFAGASTTASLERVIVCFCATCATGTRLVSRGCDYPINDHYKFSGCVTGVNYTAGLRYNSVAYCACSSDLCNTATTTLSSRYTITIVPIMVFMWRSV
jgi:hypothetical protein